MNFSISYAQDNGQIYTTVDHRVFDNYIFIEIGIHNRTQQTIYVLKEYYIEDLTIENNNIILTVTSSWLSSIVGFDSIGNIIWISSSINHRPTMIEIRENQIGYLSLLLRLPDIDYDIGNSSILFEITGIRYSTDRNVTANGISFDLILDQYNYILSKFLTLGYRYTDVYRGENHPLF